MSRSSYAESAIFRPERPLKRAAQKRRKNSTEWSLLKGAESEVRSGFARGDSKGKKRTRE